MVGAFLLTRDIFMEERIPCYYHYLSSHLAPGAIPGASRLIIVVEVAWVCPSAAAEVAALAAEAAVLAAEVVAWVCPSASAAEAAVLVVESAAELVLVSEPASAVLTVAYTSRALQPSCHPAPRS
jgi:hypothetical protein